MVLVQGGCLITYPSSELGSLFVGVMMGKRGTLTDSEAFLVSTQGCDRGFDPPQRFPGESCAPTVGGCPEEVGEGGERIKALLL